MAVRVGQFLAFSFVALVWANQVAVPDLSTKQRVCVEVTRDAVACVMTILSPWNATLESHTAVDALCAAGASEAHDLERLVPGVWSGPRSVTWTSAGRVLPELHAICTNTRPNGPAERNNLREQVHSSVTRGTHVTRAMAVASEAKAPRYKEASQIVVAPSELLAMTLRALLDETGHASFVQVGAHVGSTRGDPIWPLSASDDRVHGVAVEPLPWQHRALGLAYNATSCAASHPAPGQRVCTVRAAICPKGSEGSSVRFEYAAPPVAFDASPDSWQARLAMPAALRAALRATKVGGGDEQGRKEEQEVEGAHVMGLKGAFTPEEGLRERFDIFNYLYRSSSSAMGRVATVEASTTVDYAGDWADHGASNSTAHAATEVPCASLSSLVRDYRPWLRNPNSRRAMDLLVVDAEGLDAEVVSQALDLPRHERPLILAFEHAIGLRGRQFFSAATQLSERLALAGYACGATTALDTLCALVPPPHQPVPSRTNSFGASSSSSSSSSSTRQAEPTQELLEVGNDYVTVPHAVAALAAALAPVACTGGKNSAAEVAARALEISVPVHVTQLGGEAERLEVGMALSNEPLLGALQKEAPWLWASSSQWLACLGLGLNLKHCNELRDAWCRALRAEPFLST